MSQQTTDLPVACWDPSRFDFVFLHQLQFMIARLVSWSGRFSNSLCLRWPAVFYLFNILPTYYIRNYLSRMANDRLPRNISSALAIFCNWLGCVCSCDVVRIGSARNTITARRFFGACLSAVCFMAGQLRLSFGGGVCATRPSAACLMAVWIRQRGGLYHLFFGCLSNGGSG